MAKSTDDSIDLGAVAASREVAVMIGELEAAPEERSAKPAWPERFVAAGQKSQARSRWPRRFAAGGNKGKALASR